MDRAKSVVTNPDTPPVARLAAALPDDYEDWRPFWRRVDERDGWGIVINQDRLARAILAADPQLAAALDLGLAWQAAESALPERWKPYLSLWWDARDPGWRAAASEGGLTRPIPVIGKGDTKQAALLALADRLTETK